MRNEVISQANRLAGGNDDLYQNLLSYNYFNLASAANRGKKLSIGEQVNFMKYRASELRSGVRYDFGHGHYKGSEDIYNQKLYFSGDVEIRHFDYEDDAGNTDDTASGKGELVYATSIKNPEDQILFNIVLEQFIAGLGPRERAVVTMKLSGYNNKEIAKIMMVSQKKITDILRKARCRYVEWFDL